MTWITQTLENNQTCLIYSNTKLIKPPSNNQKIKVIGFSLEHTIIKPSELGFWISNPNEWQYCYDLSILKQYIKDNYHVIIISNQTKLGMTGFLTLDQFKNMIETISHELDIPLQVFVATQYGITNKPLSTLWDVFLQYNKIEDSMISRHQSSYIGAKAGRIKNSQNKKDINTIDFYFSRNINLQFKTPEQFFQHSKDVRHMLLPISFNPKYYIKKHQQNFKDILSDYSDTTNQNIILLMGSPGSGKSRLCRNYLPNHVRINQDNLKTVKNCYKKAITKLDDGSSIIIDNTNRYIKTRSMWIELANKYNIPIDCIHIDISRNMALHFNSYRHICQTGNCKIPDMAIYSYFTQKPNKKFEYPTVDEGFKNVITLHIDSNYDDDKTKKILNGYIRDTYHASYILG